MLVRSPPANYHKYLDAGNNPIESGSKPNDNSDKEKTDNNTSRTNKEQTNITPRFIQPNHGAVFGLYPKDGYILPGRTLAAERRGDGLDKPTKSDKKENNDNPKSIEVIKKPDIGKNTEPSFEDYTSVRHGINAANEKRNLVNHKVEALDSGWRHIPHRVGEVETDMASKGRMVDELEWRNKVHSAKIHELERELKQVQLENRNIKGQLLNPEGPGYDPRYDAIPEQDERYYGNQVSPRRGEPSYNRDEKYNLFEDQAKERYVLGRDGQPSRLAKNDQYNAHHVGKITDEQGRSYWGLNKIYDQDNLTSYRHEHIPYLMNKAEREKMTQYQRDFETEFERNRRKEEEYKTRQKEMEGKLMRVDEKFADFKRPFDIFNPPKDEDKPKTYEYTAPYQSQYPPSDINKYFHHPQDRRPKTTMADDEYNRLKGQALLDTTYEKEYVGYEFKNPNLMGYEKRIRSKFMKLGQNVFKVNRMDTFKSETVYFETRKGGKANPPAGGLFLLRFHDASLSDVNTALHLLQRQLSHSGAHVGLASSENVMLILGSSSDWRLDKKMPRKQIRIEYDCVQNAMLSIWFPSKANAEELFRSEHNNRFRDEIFLYPHPYQSAFLPLREVPRDTFDSFLVIEVQGKYHPDDLQDFEANSRAIILQLCPRSQPFFCSVGFKQLQMSIESIKGAALFKQGSRVFISAFEQLTDIADIWATGALYDMMTKNRINPGHVQVYAFSTKDTKYHFSSPHWR